jgi:hypothetical protein
MPEHHHLERTPHHLVDDLVQAHRAELGVEQIHREAGVDQRTADAEQAQRRQVVVGDAAAEGGVGRLDQGDLHAGTHAGWVAGRVCASSGVCSPGPSPPGRDGLAPSSASQVMVSIATRQGAVNRNLTSSESGRRDASMATDLWSD